MPFNLLLLPLLAGFIVISKIYIYRYSTSQLAKEQLLLSASLAGLVTLVLSRVACVTIVHLGGDRLAVAVHDAVPFQYVGTALGTIIIAYLAKWLLNTLVPENLAGFWLYNNGAFNQLETLLLHSAIGCPPNETRMGDLQLFWRQGRRTLLLWLSLLFHKWRWIRRPTSIRNVARLVGRWGRRHRIFAASAPRPLMLTMHDGKVYVGLIDELPPVTSGALQYVRVLPIWSGYRDPTNKQVLKTTSYKDVVEAADDPSIFLKVLPFAEIQSANLFETDAFDIADGEVRVPAAASQEKGV